MNDGRRLGILLLVSLAWPAAGADEDPRAALRARMERIEALRAERPGDGLLVYYKAMTHAGLGERKEALDALRTLRGRRLGIVPARGLGFDDLWADPEFQEVRAGLAAEEARTPESPVGFRLKDAALVPEGIAFDPRGRTFYLGSVFRKKIVAVDPKGNSHDFSRSGDKLDSVLGVAVDGRRRALYAVSTNVFLRGTGEERRNSVVRYDLKSRRLTARFDVPDAEQLNDVAVAGDGTLYSTDSAGASVFRRRPGEAGFSRIGDPGTFPGANGIAVAPGGGVYVALNTGIGRIDPDGISFRRLPQPDEVVTGGIDGLYWHEGDLLGIQNATNPGRVVRIALSDQGTRIAGLTVLQSHHHPAFDDPTTGAVSGGTLYVIGNSHVGRVKPDGSLEDQATMKPTSVVAVPLRR